MPDTDPNLTIDVTGNTGSIATEWVTTGGITNAHVQIVKLAWGDTNTATRVKTSTPLPVSVLTSGVPTIPVPPVTRARLMLIVGSETIVRASLRLLV